MQKVLLTIFLGWLLNVFYSSVSMAYEKEVQTLCASMAESIRSSGRKSLAVVDFTDLRGNVTELGRFLAEEISVTLAGLGKGIEVIDRTHLKVILQEHKLATTGLIDPATARKLGKIAGVESLATGTITPFGDSVRVSVKIMDADTAKIIAASTANIAKTRIIEELVAKGIEPDRPASQRSPPGGSPVTLSPSTPHGMAEDSYLRIAVLDFKKSGNVSATVQLEYQNKTDKDININYAGPHAFLMDDLGNKSVGWGSLPGFILPSKGTKSVGMRFEFTHQKKGDKLGNEFTLTVKHKSNPPGQISITSLKER